MTEVNTFINPSPVIIFWLSQPSSSPDFQALKMLLKLPKLLKYQCFKSDKLLNADLECCFSINYMSPTCCSGLLQARTESTTITRLDIHLLTTYTTWLAHQPSKDPKVPSTTNSAIPICGAETPALVHVPAWEVKIALQVCCTWRVLSWKQGRASFLKHTFNQPVVTYARQAFSCVMNADFFFCNGTHLVKVSKSNASVSAF